MSPIMDNTMIAPIRLVVIIDRKGGSEQVESPAQSNHLSPSADHGAITEEPKQEGGGK